MVCCSTYFFTLQFFNQPYHHHQNHHHRRCFYEMSEILFVMIVSKRWIVHINTQYLNMWIIKRVITTRKPPVWYRSLLLADNKRIQNFYSEIQTDFVFNPKKFGPKLVYELMKKGNTFGQVHCYRWNLFYSKIYISLKYILNKLNGVW